MFLKRGARPKKLAVFFIHYLINFQDISKILFCPLVKTSELVFKQKFKAGSKIELGRGQKVSDTTSASLCRDGHGFDPKPSRVGSRNLDLILFYQKIQKSKKDFVLLIFCSIFTFFCFHINVTFQDAKTFFKSVLVGKLFGIESF